MIMKINPSQFHPNQLTLPTNELQNVIDMCYNEFFSPEFQCNARQTNWPNFYNLILHLHDFVTIFKWCWAIWAGDVGQLMYMWRQWVIMAQGMPGLKHYAINLPQMILLLNKVLPASLQSFLRHSRLVTPSGSPNNSGPLRYTTLHGQ